MLVCYELGKTEDEVGSWDLKTLFRWVAFFQLKNEAEKKAIKEAQRKSGHK